MENTECLVLTGVEPSFNLKGKEVALVGNSPNSIGLKNGSLIDSFSDVFRFNGAPTAGFEADVGTKTTAMLMGIDLGFLFCPPYIMPNRENPDRVREHNANALLDIYNCPFFVFNFREDDIVNNRMYRSAHKYLNSAAESRGIRLQFHFYTDDPTYGLTNCHATNSVLEKLGCSSRLKKGGPRTGLRMAIRLLLSGASPTLFGFTLDPSVNVAQHYHDKITNDKADEHNAHDIVGEAKVLLELKKMGLINTH